MFETLLDINNLSTLYTFYGSIVIGLTLNYFWNLKVEYPLITSIRPTAEVNIQILFNSINNKNKSVSFVIVWIIKYIRRKNTSSDDEEGMVYLPLQTV